MEMIIALTYLFQAIGWALMASLFVFGMYQMFHGIDHHYQQENARIDAESKLRQAEIEEKSKRNLAEIEENARRVFVVWNKARTDSRLYDRATKAMAEGGSPAIVALYNELNPKTKN